MIMIIILGMEYWAVVSLFRTNCRSINLFAIFGVAVSEASFARVAM